MIMPHSDSVGMLAAAMAAPANGYQCGVVLLAVLPYFQYFAP